VNILPHPYPLACSKYCNHFSLQIDSASGGFRSSLGANLAMLYFICYRNGIRHRHLITWILTLSLDSVVGIATGYGTGRPRGPEFESRQGQEFSVLRIVQTCFGVHPAYCIMGTAGICLHGAVLRYLSTGTTVPYLT
jgi:hypothetical protein